jgi:hypothetical protein
MNIVDLVKDQLTSQVLGSLGSLVGTNEAQTKAASAAAVPAILGGLAKLAGNAQGAGQLANALGGLDLGMLGNLAGVLGGANSSKISNMGGTLLGSLFGNTATSAIVETLASFLGIKGGMARSMLSYLAPVVLGTIAKQITSGGKSIDASGIQSLFADQSRNIQSALPAGLSLGDFGSIAKAVTSAASGGASHSSHGHVERQQESSGFPSWLPWLALPLIALAAFFLMKKDKGGKPVDKGAAVVNSTDMMKKMAEGQKAGEALAEKAAEKGAEAVKTTTDAVAAVVEKATDAIDMTAFGGDVAGLFGKLTDSFKGITDVPSAEAAVPGLKDLAGILEGYKATADKLPEAGKATVKEMVGTNLGTLQPIIDTVLAIPGVGDILRPIVEPMLKTLSALGL